MLSVVREKENITAKNISVQKQSYEKLETSNIVIIMIVAIYHY